jgi:saccharopine dehydrogenase (NAD+, L-lysine-forming)
LKAKITILGGCGVVGSSAVKALLSLPDFSEIIIGDINIEKAREFALELDSDKISVIKVDANDPESIKSCIKDSDVVLNCIGPFYEYALVILKAAIETGRNYVDVCDDVDATRTILKLDSEAKEAGITALIGMGSSPGITNLLAKFAVDQMLDEVDSVDLYHAHGGEPSEGPGVIAHRFHSMTIEIPIFIDGEFKTVTFFGEEGQALIEEVDFAKIGRYTVYPYPHPEIITLPKYLKGVKRVTNKGVVLPPEYFQLTIDAVKLGLADEKPLKVQENNISPKDFATSFLIRERERILKDEDFGSQRGCVKIVVKGKKEGVFHQYNFSIASKSQALGEGTGIPAALGVALLKRGKIMKKGVLPPEACVNPLDFLNIIQEHLDLETVTSEGSPLIIESIDAEGKVERTTL